MNSTFLLMFLLVFMTFLCQGAEVCPNGYYGPRCSRRCLGHCSNNLCYLVYTGNAVKCREGCEKGWRGPACSIKCKYSCLECEKHGGECIGPCRDGYYGPGCSTRCPGNCRKCVMVSGFCEHSCIDGYYGNFCSESCSCDRCDRETGRCLNPKIVKPTSPATVFTSPEHLVASLTESTSHERIKSTNPSKQTSNREWHQGQDMDGEKVSDSSSAHTVMKREKETMQPQSIALVSVLIFGGVVTLIAVSYLTLDRDTCTLCIRRDRSTVRQMRSVREQRPIENEEDHIYADVAESTETRCPRSIYLNPVFEPNVDRRELPGYNTFSNHVRT